MIALSSYKFALYSIIFLSSFKLGGAVEIHGPMDNAPPQQQQQQQQQTQGSSGKPTFIWGTVGYDGLCRPQNAPKFATICFDLHNFTNELSQSTGDPDLMGFVTDDGNHLAIPLGAIGSKMRWETPTYLIQLVAKDGGGIPCAGFLIAPKKGPENYRGGVYCVLEPNLQLSGA